MSQEEEYPLLRERFAELCAKLVSASKAEERKVSAVDEFDQFCGHPKISFVALQDDVLAFITTRLVMSGPFGPRWAGEFAVRLCASTREIICLNISDPGRLMRTGSAPHPHVFGMSNQFHPCLGDANKIWVGKLFGDGKLAELGLFMVEFLELYGDFSTTASPKEWPELSEEELIAWKTGR